MTDVATQDPSATPAAPPPVSDAAPADAKPTAVVDKAAETPVPEAKPDEGKPSVSFLGDAPDQDKPADDKAPEADSPEEISIVLPEGTKADEHLLSGFVGFAKEAGLSNETANKVAGWYAGEIAKQNQAMEGAIQRQSEGWAKDLEADPDFGGKNLDQSRQNLARFQRQYGDDEFRAEMKRLGIDNHPSLVKLFARVGADLGEDDSSGGGGVAPKSQESQLHKRYPNSVNPDGSLKR